MENENWTIKARAKIINTATEIKFKKITVKYTWMDYKRDEVILREVKPEHISEKIQKHKTGLV
jgi:hypothetical protein